MAGQLARLHLDRLLHVLTRIERGHKLLQRWRWSCGFMIGRCLILGGGWEREGLKTGKERTSSFAGGGQEGRQEACTWLRKDTERLLGRVYLCARVACRSLFHPPSLPPSSQARAAVLAFSRPPQQQQQQQQGLYPHSSLATPPSSHSPSFPPSLSFSGRGSHAVLLPSPTTAGTAAPAPAPAPAPAAAACPAGLSSSLLSPLKEPQAAAALVPALPCVVVRGRPRGREGGREGRKRERREGEGPSEKTVVGRDGASLSRRRGLCCPFSCGAGHEDETGAQVLRVARPATELASLHGESQSSSLPFLFPPSVPPSLLSLPSRALIPSSAFSFVVLEAMVFSFPHTNSLPPSLAPPFSPYS